MDQGIEHHPMQIHSPLEPMLLPSGADHNLIEVPFVSRHRTVLTALVGKVLAELSAH
jgi:hypothetical protein